MPLQETATKLQEIVASSYLSSSQNSSRCFLNKCVYTVYALWVENGEKVTIFSNYS